MTENALHILVVDDDMLARMTAVQCVKQGGHTANMAEGGAAAMKMLQSEGYDLVLLDLLMPNVDGFEVLRQIRENPQIRDVPVIMVSGSGGPDSMARCVEMGACGYLPKPLDPDLLTIEITRCLDKEASS